MAPVFLPAIDFKTFESESKGLSPKELAYLGHVFTEVSADSIDEACSYLQRTFSNFASYVEVTGLDSVEDVIDLLHAGASKVFVSEAQLDQLLKIKDVDFDRVFLQLTAAPESAPVLAKKAIDTGCGGVYFRDLKAWRKSQSGNQAHLAVKYVALERPTPEELKSSEARSNIPVISATALTTDIKANPSLMPVSEWFLANASSDRPDGLLSTVVTDERGVALGFVYSSKESISESLRTGTGVYQSRKRGLWYKGATSGDTQQLVRIDLDCDQDCIRFVVRQEGRGFCHLGTATCFGQYAGLSRLQQTLQSRKASAPEGSYTARLFNSPQLLRAKIMEEAEELCDATSKDNIAFEAADLIYFALTKCVAAGVSLEDVEKSLDAKSVKVKRRKGDAKGQWAAKAGLSNGGASSEKKEAIKEAASVPKAAEDSAGTEDGKIHMKRYITAKTSQKELDEALQRPSQRSSETIMGIVNPIIKNVRDNGDAALLDYTHKFEKATSLTSPVIRAPFPKSMMQLPAETVHAIDVSFENIRKFHEGQKDKPLTVETMPGVVCSRFSRPIERVGLYIPGGTAVLPSTALMLGVPAMVAGCKKIVLASPPRADGSVTPEIVYVAHKVGAESIVLAGGAQAVAALAYGTESVSKVDKILGPGNQFVTAGKMVVSNDTTASVSIDMPAGPSEVLVIADETANPAFVASDLLSQAEHGVDSQVILIAVNLTEAKLAAIEEQVHLQASALPRVDIVRGSINHSITLVVKDINEAMTLSNKYAPEHLILQVQNAEKVVDLVENAGSVFIGPWTPESVGDYSAGVNHSLPTYGYAKQYSGVNLGSYLKHITSSNLTAEGLKNVGGAVMQLAKVEELEAHRRAVSIRLEHMSKVSS